MTTHRGKRGGAKVRERTPLQFDEGLATALAALVIHAGLEETKANEFVLRTDPDTLGAAMANAENAGFRSAMLAGGAGGQIALHVAGAVAFVRGLQPDLIILGGDIWNTICDVTKRSRGQPIEPDDLALYAKRVLINYVQMTALGRSAQSVLPTFSRLMVATVNMPQPAAEEAPAA